MLKSIRSETLKTLGISAGLIAAIAASGALLVAHAAPGPAVTGAQAGGQTFSSLQSQADAASSTFAAHCSADLTVDLRPDPKWVAESYANDNCWAPALPPFLDGFAADGTKVNGSMAAMQKYIVQAHVFQKCIANFVSVSQTAAEKIHHPLDKNLILIEDHRIAASRTNEKKVATEVEITIDQFNQSGSDCTDGGDITFREDGPNADGVSDAGNDLDTPG